MVRPTDAPVRTLVDTPVWSLAMRRRHGDLGPRDRRLFDAWSALVSRGAATMIGPVRQEILSGIRDASVFAALADRLAEFDDLPLGPSDFVRAAAFFNRCRNAGIAGSPTDL